MIYYITTIIQYPLYFICNLFTFLIGFFIHRDPGIYLFGCHTGYNFSGNSRNMFLYLSKNKNLYNIKKVIFVTKSHRVNKSLLELGYESYLMHSFKGIYFHLKAGRHICNGNITNSFAVGHYESADILSFLSLGAEHFYLHHHLGTGKSNLMLNRENLTGAKRILVESYRKALSLNWFRHLFMFPGGWDDMTFCVSCNEQLLEDRIFFEHFPIRFVTTCFPELLPSPDYLPHEKAIIDSIPKERTIVLYCPAYRTAKTDFINPLTNQAFVDFLEQENYFWIEKLMTNHTYDMAADDKCYKSPAVLRLSGTFDLNILSDVIDIMVTDYSSARMKAVIRNKPVIYYVPDYELYDTKDKGILPHMKKVISLNRADSTNELCQRLSEACNAKQFFSSERIDEYEKEKKTQIDISPSIYNYNQIFCDIFQ